jgi:FAD/FMN-containing dehydrogenase
MPVDSQLTAIRPGDEGYAEASKTFTATGTPVVVARLHPSKTYQRLADVKRRYDPTNLFSQNFNIVP